jgi:hypothetical protein
VLDAKELYGHFSGLDCANSLRMNDCQAFLVFTLTFLRALSYSLAAFTFFRIIRKRSCKPDTTT